MHVARNTNLEVVLPTAQLSAILHGRPACHCMSALSIVVIQGDRFTIPRLIAHASLGTRRGLSGARTLAAWTPVEG